jgi:hypothetical protein
MGIEDVLTALRAPWQNAFVERFIGSARRECFDHVIVFNEAGLHRLMTQYCSYHERSRKHLSLDKDTPIPRPVTPPEDGGSRRSAASIIATNGAQPERASRRRLDTLSVHRLQAPSCWHDSTSVVPIPEGRDSRVSLARVVDPRRRLRDDVGLLRSTRGS